MKYPILKSFNKSPFWIIGNIDIMISRRVIIEPPTIIKDKFINGRNNKGKKIIKMILYQYLIMKKF